MGVDASGGERYMYDPSNKRIYKQSNGGNVGQTYYFYGVDGKVMGEYTSGCADGSGCGSSGLTLNVVTESAYFGGKKVVPSMVRDRLGSVRAQGSNANHPYGENYSVSGWGVTGTDGFATYYQDSSTGLNYADQRYYKATYGRFMIPDHFRGGSSPTDPGSWNQYIYVGDDPVNRSDPGGMGDENCTWDPSTNTLTCYLNGGGGDNGGAKKGPDSTNQPYPALLGSVPSGQ